MPEVDSLVPQNKAESAAKLDSLTDTVAKPSATLRNWNDIPVTRDSIYSSALRGVNDRFASLENNTHKFVLNNARYDEKLPTLKDEHEAILARRTLSRKMYGDLNLVDKATGETVSSRPGLVLAHVPHYTNRGTFIRGGSEYMVFNQQRLKPGVYTRVKKSGDFEAQFNVLPGTGRGFRLQMDPATGVFKFQVGQGTVKAYPVMKALGIDDETLKATWGSDLWSKNVAQKTGRGEDTFKFAKSLGTSYDDVTEQNFSEVLPTILNRMKLDTRVTSRTLGKPYDTVNPQALLDSSKKLLAVSRGESDPDERDSVDFQSFHSVEDFMYDHMKNDSDKAARKALWKSTFSKDLAKIPTGMLDANLDSIFMASRLGSMITQVNPLEVLDLRHKISRMGEGGVGDMRAISREARGLQPSHFGLIDPLRAPECYDDKTEVMTFDGWKLWSEVSEQTKFACLVDNKLEFNKADSLFSADYSGVMFGAKTRSIDYLVTPNHRMWTRCRDPLRSGKKCGMKFNLPSEIEGKSRNVISSGFSGFDPKAAEELFYLPVVDGGNALNKPVPPIPMTDWLEFLGWFLSEGCFKITNGDYKTYISQSSEVNLKNFTDIHALLERLPFSFCKNKTAFIISGKQLATYLSQFGKSDSKFIPEYAFSASLEARTKLFDTLLLGDGRTSKQGDKRVYCTTSKQLASDFVRLAFSLGRSTSVSTYIDKRKDTYLPLYEIYLHTRPEHTISGKNYREEKSAYYREENYEGKVHCASVPGGLLYVRRNNSIGFWCGNSLRIGLDSRLAYRTFKGSDNNIYSEVKDVNTGELKTVPSSVMVDSVVAFPGEMNSKKKYISAMKGGSMQLVEKKEVQYELPHSEDTFSPLTNMIPLMAHAKGQRMLMGSRMATQALSLVNPEARSVQAKDSRTGRSFDEVYGSDLGAVFADGEGVVSKVTSEAITIKNEDGTEKTHELYNNFPFNTKGFLHNTPIVKEGTKVGPGMILAKSNFTDASGRAAYGKNLRVAFHPYNIYTHDDGIVISESAAKKMSSEMMFKEKLAKDDFVDDVNKNRFISLFPGKLKKEQLDNIDDDGIIKLGSTVNPGDPLLLAIGKTKPSAAGAIMRQKKSMFTDNAITWDHDYPAIITDARKAKDGWQITLKSAVPVREGDKLANSFGGKGVVSKIIPDEKMLKDTQGNLLDIVVSPAGLVSRVNPAQILESQLAKIAAKTGIPYVLPGFNQEQDLHDFMLKELAKYELTDTEDIYDPEIDKTLPKVLTGSMYFMRLMHTADGKMSGRGLGQYSSDFAPAKGGDDEQQAKRFGNLDLNALVSYGATEVLKDRIIRGQQNDEYWKMYRLGYTPPKPTVFEPYQRFLNYVRGSGAQIKDDGNFLHLMPFTDKAIEELGGHEIKSGESYDFNSMEPIPGGLFDVANTGGKDGNKWSYIKLHKPIPNPAIEAPIASLLELSPAKLKQVLEGEESIGSLTGPDAVQYALSKINVKEGIEREKYNIATKKRDQRDKAVKRLRLLTMMNNYNMSPADLMISKIPVLPPKYRPIAMMNGTQLISDPNYLYKEVFEANDNMKQTETKLGQKESFKDLGVVYSAVKAVFGMGDPVTVKNQEKNVRGLLRDFVGKGSPKGGSWQRRVLGGTVDTVGRGVIIPDPNLPMDFVSLPDEMAWKMFEPFVMRSLVRGGMPAVAAKDSIEQRSGMAEKALDAIMNQRPIMMNRAPTLHKHNFTAHWAQRHKGSAIKVPLATLPGWGADFDGDAMNVHVPVGDEAVKDAVEKMMPSRNLFSAKNMSVHMKPEQMALLGLYKATAPATAGKKPVRFKSRADVILAYNRGDIGPTDPVIIEE